ncbi:MAG: alanine--glyoxylate aminotransferase family protein [Acidobacteria bacterium]|nr:alanine--glyoxylate aminotransferase family protein [Acidobacteriota bacterium]
MAESEIHHRTEEFKRILREALAGLRYFFQTQEDILIFASSGTGAMESAVANLLSPGDRALVVVGGKFGERWEELCKAYQVGVEKIAIPYGQALDPRVVRQRLEAGPSVGAVFVQAVETSTATEYDVRSLGAIVHEFPDTCLVVDAITGLGTMELRTQDWHLDLVVGGSQKAFMLPPGLSFVSVSEKAWRRVERSGSPRYYFDYRRERKSVARDQTAYTPAVSLIVGLSQVLRFVQEQGLDNVIRGARLQAEATRAAARALGLQVFSHSPCAACTGIRPPEGIPSTRVVQHLRKEFGLVIAAGQGELKEQLFRIAHIGYFDFYDILGMIGCLELTLEQLGHSLSLGSGVRAALQTYCQRREPGEPGE